MKYNRPNIYDMIDSLTIEEKKYLVGYLLDSTRKTEEIVPSLTCLEEQWMKIRRLMKSLDYEPYIDDQVEIEEIWNICEDLIKSGKIEDTSWNIRRAILQEIIQRNPEERLEYVLVGESGPAHDKTFEVEIHLNSNVIGKGTGHSKKLAEQAAAGEALKLMGVEV